MSVHSRAFLEASAAPRHRPSTPHARAPASARSVALNVEVSDVMSQPAISIGAEASIFDALVAMRTHGISGLPVLGSSQTVVGVLSEHDVARVFAEALSVHEVKALLDVLLVGVLDQPTESLRAARERLEEASVSSAMTAPAFVIHPDAPLELAAEVMVENSINRVPVVLGERLVGVVTRHDLIHAMVAPPR